MRTAWKPTEVDGRSGIAYRCCLASLAILLVVRGPSFGQSVPAVSETDTYTATDSLAISPDASQDAQACLDDLAWAPEDFAVTVTPAPGPKHLYHVCFPSPRPCGVETIDEVTCEWYAASESDAPDRLVKRPAVVVVHESGSDMKIGRLMATEFRRRGLHAFLVQLPGYGTRQSERFTPDDLIQVFVQGLADVRRARDAVAALPVVDSRHIVLQGTSLGGFVATMSASLDGKFDSVFLLLCGGDLHGVLTTGAKDAKKTLQRLLKSGVRQEQLQVALQRIEPTRIAHRLPAASAWLYSGAFDRVVPPSHSQLLADKIGLSPDHHVHMWANHYSGVLYLPGIVEKIRSVALEDIDSPLDDMDSP